tara:strand:- start:29752 stop:31485 length:1734 start_codon:yes stop_codon:yes gene_type:complete
MAQIVSGEIDTVAVVIDSSESQGIARATQARFERRRIRYFPLILGWANGACDERVGRFCSWYDEGDWYPRPELVEAEELREELLFLLDSIQALLPGDGWLLGQRVWYLSEARRWEEALEAARSCGTAEPWWCAALEGFSLHGLGRYVEADRAFSIAIDRMDNEQSLRWRVPRWVMDDDGQNALKEAATSSPEALDNLLERLWLLADPLYLVEGNDRKTSHYARWTVAKIREEAKNPYRISWGNDLDELTIRHGWELGWDRTSDAGSMTVEHVIGHKHPEGRDYMPPGKMLNTPSLAAPGDLRADVERPRSLYAPAYAPVLLPMEGQVAFFPRGSRVVVVGTHFLPDDTTRHVGHDHPIPWLDPGTQDGMLDRAGIFLVPLDGARIKSAQVMGHTEGALSLEVPSGSYVLSIETWNPRKRRAGRLRMGFESQPVPEDVASLSDILMLRPSSKEPEVLAAALPQALKKAEILTGQTFAIAWEVSGLGFRSETLLFEVSVSPINRGVLRQIGEFLRITKPARPLRLSWEESGPLSPGPLFRYLNLDLPNLKAGKYEVRMVLKTVGRADAVSTRVFSVQER